MPQMKKPSKDIDLPARKSPLTPAGAERRLEPRDDVGGPMGWEEPGPGELLYRTMANGRMGGNVYGNAKGADWASQISPEVLEQILRALSPQAELGARANTLNPEADTALRGMRQRQLETNEPYLPGSVRRRPRQEEFTH